MYFRRRGPCARNRTGEPFRRHLRFEGMREGVTRHVTKGRLYDSRRWPGPIESALILPTTGIPRARLPNAERLHRNDASRWAARRVEAPEVMTRQRRRAMERASRA